MKNVIPMIGYSPFEIIKEEVPTSHHNFGYVSSLNVKFDFFTKIRKNSKMLPKTSRFMTNVIPMFRYSPFEVIDEEVPISHNNFGYASSFNVKIQLFTQNWKNPKILPKISI